MRLRLAHAMPANLRFPHLIECTRCCVLEILCTALGIRCAVGSAGVAGYGCVWHGSSCPLFMLGAFTLLYTIVAAYGSIRPLSFLLMVSVRNTTLHSCDASVSCVAAFTFIAA